MDGVHIGIHKVDGVHIVQWRRLHLLPLGTAVYYLSDPLFFLKHNLGRGLPGGQRGEPGFEPRTGSSTLGDFAICLMRRRFKPFHSFILKILNRVWIPTRGHRLIC